MTKDGFLELLPAIREAARKLGYAVGLHGTLARDYDLIAAPWTEEAASPDDLAEAIKEAAGCIRWRVFRGLGMSRREVAKRYGCDVTPDDKPHGRLVYCFDWDKQNTQNADYIDLSVMPRVGCYTFRLATGWITPEGQYYSCWPWDHDKIVVNILADAGHENATVALAERLGYIRVTGRCGEPFLNAEHPTQAQIDTMHDYKVKHGSLFV